MESDAWPETRFQESGTKRAPMEPNGERFGTNRDEGEFCDLGSG